jgi:hypothetical protein
VGPWRLERQTSTVSSKRPIPTKYFVFYDLTTIITIPGVQLESKTGFWSDPTTGIMDSRSCHDNPCDYMRLGVWVRWEGCFGSSCPHPVLW